MASANGGRIAIWAAVAGPGEGPLRCQRQAVTEREKRNIMLIIVKFGT